MASLTSQSIAGSYEQLLHVDRDGGGNGTTLVDVKDGDNGTTFALKLAQFHAEIRGTTGTGATGAGKLNLSIAELTVVDNDVLGRIDFLAPLESSGTDAVLAGASIWGEAEDTFAADNNSTALVFATNTSAAATERMRIGSDGNTTFAGGLTVTSEADSKAAFRLYTSSTLLGGIYNSSGKVHLRGEGDRDVSIGSSNNADRVVIDTSTGNVGIGTTPASDSRLHLYSATHGADLVQKFQAENDSGTVIPFYFALNPDTDTFSFYGDVADSLVINAGTGNAGIGVAPVGANLHIKGAASNYAVLKLESASASHGTIIEFGDPTDDDYGTITQFASSAGEGGRMRFIAGTTETMNLHGGNVFIGQTAYSNNSAHTLIGLGGNAGLHATASVGASGELGLAHNIKNTGSAWVTISTDEHTMYTQAGGNHNFYAWASASAGATVSEWTNSKVAIFDANSRSSLSNNDAGGTDGSNSTSGNTVFGYIAGQSIEDGCIDNTFIGHGVASGSLNNATNNVGVGGAALIGITTADYNTAVGTSALFSNSTANNNTAIGNRAGGYTTGADNTYVGYFAGKGAAGADAYNVGVGSNALLDVTTGNHNVVLGYNSADSLTTASKCIIIGAAAGRGITTTGGSNVSDGTVAIGYAAGNAITSGSQNTAVGYSAADSVTTGNNNTVLGYEALVDNVVGGANTAIGRRALYDFVADADSHGWNTAVGNNALYDLTTGTSNTAIGSNAGDIGSNDLTTGNNNTLLGSETGVSAVGATNQTAIGFGAVGNQNNGTVIGSASVFQFASKEYTCDHADGEDGKSAASEASPLKLPAYSIIKSVSVIVSQLSDIGTYNVALYHSTDTSAPADDTALGGTPVEILGAGASDTCSGNSASAVDIALGSGAVVKQSYYNAYGGAGLPVGTADRYIHVGQAGTGNGDTDPSQAGIIKVLVEYVGLD